jgi:hypothetical protein
MLNRRQSRVHAGDVNGLLIFGGGAPGGDGKN